MKQLTFILFISILGFGAKAQTDTLQPDTLALKRVNGIIYVMNIHDHPIMRFDDFTVGMDSLREAIRNSNLPDKAMVSLILKSQSWQDCPNEILNICKTYKAYNDFVLKHVYGVMRETMGEEELRQEMTMEQMPEE